MSKEVKKNNSKNNFYFTIYTYLKQGKSISDIASLLDVSKQKLNYYISHLKRANIIKKLGYGVWETNEFDILKLKQVKTSKKKSPEGTMPTSKKIRGHAFQFKLKLSNIPNWKKRRKFLEKNNIRYKPINHGESIYFKGHKIWLTNKSIIIYDKHSYLSDSAIGAKNYAIYNMHQVILGLENLFKVSLKIGGKHIFTVDKQHYARMNDSLAKQYRVDGKKLAVRQENGTVWFWLDYSLNIDESETGNTERSDIDMDEHIHPFLNSLRNVKGYTPNFVINMFGETNNQLQQLIQDREYFAENMKSHVHAVHELAKGVQELRQTINFNQISPLDRIKSQITSLDSLKDPMLQNQIGMLNQDEKQELESWIFSKFS